MLTPEKIDAQLQTLGAIKLAFNAYIPVVNSAGDALRENLKTDDSAELVAIVEAFNANIRALNAAGEKVGDLMRTHRNAAHLRPGYIPPPPATENVPPTVNIVTPPAGFTASSPANVPISVLALPFGAATIQSVQVYRGVTAVGSPITVATAMPDASINVALASNGGVATASSTYSAPGMVALPNFAINGDRKGANWGISGGWTDDTPATFPDWLQVTFAQAYSIEGVNVFSLQDSYTSPAEPTSTMVSTLYGLEDFDVQYWNGTTWVTFTGGAVTNNTLIWKQITFAAVSTTAIRVLVAATQDGWTRITELEALVADTPQPPQYQITDTDVASGVYPYTAVALDSNGLSTTSAPVSVTIEAFVEPPPPPPPPPPGTLVVGERIKLDYGYDGGPTESLANKWVFAAWRNAGGDWLDRNGVPFGGVRYHEYTIGGHGLQMIDFTGTAGSGFVKLIDDLRTDNTGILLNQVTGGTSPKMAASENADGWQKPELTVITNVGTYNVPLLFDCFLSQTTQCLIGSASYDATIQYNGASVNVGGPQMQLPVVMKFDVSVIQGTITSARFRGYITATYVVPMTIAFNYLDMPVPITSPETQLGVTPDPGLRGTVAEADLAAHPDCVIYSPMTPAYLGIPDGTFGSAALQLYTSNPSSFNWDAFHTCTHIEQYKTWPEYGNHPVVRIGGLGYDLPPQLNPFLQGTLTSWTHVAQPARAGKPWTTAFGTGALEYYLTYTFKNDADMKFGQIDGIKMPGFEGVYNGYIPATVDRLTVWSARMEMSMPSKNNPGLRRFLWQLYSADGAHPGDGSAEAHPVNCYFLDGKVYTIEQRVKLNTFNSGTSTWNYDGEIETRVNGVRIELLTGRKLRSAGMVEFELLPFYNFYHGGTSNPTQNIHFEAGAVWISKTKFAGPLRTSYPAWRNPNWARGSVNDIPNTRLQDLPNTGAAFNNFCGVSWDWVNGRCFSVANNGHGQIGTSDRFNGAFGITLFDNAPVWTTLRATTPDNLIQTAPGSQQIYPPPALGPETFYYLDNSPTARHSYYFQNYMPSRNRTFMVGVPCGYGPWIPRRFYVDAFDHSTNTYDNVGSWNAGATVFNRNGRYPDGPVNYNIEACGCSDPRNGDIYTSGLYDYPGSGHGWYKFRADNLTWESVFWAQPNESTFQNAVGTMIDTIRNTWVSLNATIFLGGVKAFKTIKLDASRAHQVHYVTGLTAATSWDNMNGVAHNTDLDEYIVCSRYGHLFSVNPNTLAGTPFAVTDASPANFISNKLWYFPRLKGVVIATDSGANLKFIPTE